jgi:hypothetical protein
MARPAERPEQAGLAFRVVVGLLVLIAAWLVLRFFLGFLFSLIRTLVFLVLFAVIAWVVLVGPSTGDDSSTR